MVLYYLLRKLSAMVSASIDLHPRQYVQVLLESIEASTSIINLSIDIELMDLTYWFWRNTLVMR